MVCAAISLVRVWPMTELHFNLLFALFAMYVLLRKNHTSRKKGDNNARVIYDENILQ